MTRIDRQHCYLYITQPDPQHNRLVASLVLNRPDKANAFNGAMIDELCELASLAHQYEDLAALVIQGAGKHFSAGADLEWMRSSQTLSLDENQKDARKLVNLMEAISLVPCPTLAVVKGSAYGGAVGIVAACDFALVAEDARFCLSEVRVGLMPAVILPYLGRKIQLGQLARLGVSAEVFSGSDAVHFGLAQLAAPSTELASLLLNQLECILQGSPQAQRQLKVLLRSLRNQAFQQNDATVNAIANIRISAEAQEALTAFFNKEKPRFYTSQLEALHADQDFI